ncbi:vegetative cell wall protein gp1-like [Nasonia vitripennis]|uniref:Uncharacterized protein n=1 Tax=Nasonia vitripennis TaxID=7425 RepID=A0A7M7M2B3_NASVI|nr:vegetative cell wall protein gp1-like [Nasonia vitripennis]
MNRLQAVPGSRHIPPHTPFFHGDLRTCAFVFRRVDTVKKTLQPPYTGPHKVLRRINEQTYVIEIDGAPKTISTSSLKPAYLELANQQPSRPPTQPAPAPPPTTPPSPAPSLPTPTTLTPSAPGPPALAPPVPTASPAPHSTATSAEDLAAPSPARPPQDPSLNRHQRGKAVSFRTQPAFVTGGGVAVGVPTSHHHRSRRKQTLVPRQDFS